MGVRPWLVVVVLACTAPEHSGRVGSPPPTAPEPAAPGLRLPDDVTPLAYRLTLDVDPEKDTFRGEVHIRARLDHATDHVWIHAVDLDIDSARYDGGALTRLRIAGDLMLAFGFGHVLAPRDI